MIEELKNFLSRFVKLSDEEFDDLVDFISEKRLKKKDIVFNEGEISEKLIFFFDGYFRFYYYNDEGIEITSDFYFAPNIVTSYTSLITGQPSRVYLQAMENMKVLILKKSDLLGLYQKYHNFDKLGRLLAEQVAITSEQHLLNILNQTAEKRYKTLLENQPQFIQKIPLQYIASYLGITKESLSRIRKNL